MKIIDVLQGSSEWKELRRNKISATDSGIILGLNPWVTPYQLWQRKLGLIEEQEVNEKMREGSLMEEEAREFLNRKYKWNLKPAVIESIEYPFLMASLDGMNLHTTVEIKCGKSSYELALKHEIPPYYYSQLQHQMLVTNRPVIDYFSYRSDEDNVFWTVDRDDAFIEKMIEAEKKFYECLMNFTAPELTVRDYEFRNDAEFFWAATEYKEAKSDREELEDREAALRDKLILLSGDRPCKGSGLTISKSVRKGNIDYSAIEELKSIDLNKYRKKPIEVWTIRES